MTYVQKGDVVTFLSEGTAKFGFGKGVNTESRLVSPGEIYLPERPTSVSDVDVTVARGVPPRTVMKRAYRPQNSRTCDLSLTSLELPSIEDARAKELERKLAERGAAMKQKLADMAKRLSE